MLALKKGKTPSKFENFFITHMTQTISYSLLLISVVFMCFISLNIRVIETIDSSATPGPLGVIDSWRLWRGRMANSTHTSRKIKMEPENKHLEEENHLPNHHFQVLCSSSRV